MSAAGGRLAATVTTAMMAASSMHEAMARSMGPSLGRATQWGLVCTLARGRSSSRKSWTVGAANKQCIAA